MAETKTHGQSVYVARQPIFTAGQQVEAYELLFRSGLKNAFDNVDGDQASASVLTNSFLTIGIDDVTQGKQAFINFTRDLILEEVALLFEKQQIVVEVLADVNADPAVIDACKKLRQRGYKLALDDFVLSEKSLPLVELADIVKVDFRTSDSHGRERLLRELAPKGIALLAEKVETHAEFEETIQQGFAYFQGYFFSKPVILSAKEIPAQKLNYLRVLQLVNQPYLDMRELAEVIKQDMALSYKFLRYINSAAFPTKRIESIPHALNLLVRERVRKFISLIALSAMLQDKPQELIVTSLTRAGCCEQLAVVLDLPDRKLDLFLMGMFSMIDAILDRPMNEVVESIPLGEDVRDALSGKPNPSRSVLESVMAYEQGDWERFSLLASHAGVPEAAYPGTYLSAVATTGEFLST